MPSPSVEDYIKAIYTAHAEHGHVATQDLAGRLHVSAPAVSKMLRRLSELRLISHTPYHRVKPTRAGEQLALHVLRRHRLLELFLVQVLGIDWSTVHEEADVLEHHISAVFEDRLDHLLGHPTTCPHGDPIPTPAGTMARPSYRSLACQRSPEQLVVRRVQDDDAALLRHMQTLGITPGTTIAFVTQEPFEGPCLLQVGGKLVPLTLHAARSIFVDPVPANTGDD